MTEWIQGEGEVESSVEMEEEFFGLSLLRELEHSASVWGA